MPTLAVIGGAGRRQRSLELENSMKIEAFHREGVKNMPIDPKLGIDEYITGLLIARQFTGSGRVWPIWPYCRFCIGSATLTVSRPMHLVHCQSDYLRLSRFNGNM